jgi:DNA (cytosine-5)-methyltransferase 1
MTTNKFTFIDLFCGIGGFHQALKSLGGECVFASDIDKECQLNYHENYGLEVHGDVTKIDASDVPDHDILVGGFPCQAMSNAGHKKAFNDDKRGKLFDEIVRIAKEKRPKIMMLENVKHIKKVSKGEVYRYVYDQLRDIGYHVQDVTMSPHQFGVPQLRERVYFLCLDKSLFPDIIIDVTSPVSKPTHIFEKLSKTDLSKYSVSSDVRATIDAWDEMIKKMPEGKRFSVPILTNEFTSTEDLDTLPDWKQNYVKKNKLLYEEYENDWDLWLKTHSEVLNKRAIFKKLEWQVGPVKENDSIWDYFIQLRQSGIRVKKTDYFPTLVAIVQVPIYGKEKRFLTPRECARLQSFPESYKLHKTDRLAYKQLGNSVNVCVVKHLMKDLLSQAPF